MYIIRESEGIYVLDDKNNSINQKQDNRNLSDVFKELQQIRYASTTNQAVNAKVEKHSKQKSSKMHKTKKVAFVSDNNSFYQKPRRNSSILSDIVAFRAGARSAHI